MYVSPWRKMMIFHIFKSKDPYKDWKACFICTVMWGTDGKPLTPDGSIFEKAQYSGKRVMLGKTWKYEVYLCEKLWWIDSCSIAFPEQQ